MSAISREFASNKDCLFPNDLLLPTFEYVDIGTIATLKYVCRRWYWVYTDNIDALRPDILPFGKQAMQELFSQGVTKPLLDRFAKDPNALRKINYFYLSYFSDVPESERLHSRNAETSVITRTEVEVSEERSITWRPYDAALTILFFCKSQESVGRDMHATKLLRETFPTLLPHIYHTFDHQKHPHRFLPLHKYFIDLGSDNRELNLACKKTAIDALGGNILPAQIAKLARLYCNQGDYLQAAEYYEKANKKSLESGTIFLNNYWVEIPFIKEGDEVHVESTNRGREAYMYDLGRVYYEAAEHADTRQEKKDNFSKAAAAFSKRIENNEKISTNSSYSEYRYAASSYYHLSLLSDNKLEYFGEALRLYREAKVRETEPDENLVHRIQVIEHALSNQNSM